MRILVVDDEPEITALVARGLRAEGHEVETAADGIDALAQEAERPFDVAVVDLMMPGMSGVELCRWLKRRDPRIVVIVLTARDGIDDRIRGLDEGADDYMVKPFALAELAARIRAIQRRDALSPVLALEVGDLVLDLPRRAVLAAARDLPLSRTEFDVLRALAEASPEVVPRPALLTEVWGAADGVDPNVLDQYVSYLRRKLAARGTATRIYTVRGVGYRLAENGEQR